MPGPHHQTACSLSCSGHLSTKCCRAFPRLDNRRPSVGSCRLLDALSPQKECLAFQRPREGRRERFRAAAGDKGGQRGASRLPGARALAFAMGQPDDVDINEILFRPTAQEY